MIDNKDCTPKLLFNRNEGEHMEALKYAVNATFRASRPSRGEAFNTNTFYQNLVARLLSSNTPFIAGYSEDMSQTETKKYKEAYRQMRDALLNEVIDPILIKNGLNKSELDDLVGNSLYKDLGAGNLRGMKPAEDTEEHEISKEGAQEKTPTKELNLKKYLEKVYGTSFGAIRLMRHSFSRELFTYTLCDFNRGSFVTTNTQLNENIAEFKNELLKKVIRFLQKENPGKSYPVSVHNPNGSVNTQYQNVLMEMQAYLNNMKKADRQAIIDDGFNRLVFGKEDIKLEAINAYTALRYFDSLLKDALGRVVKATSHINSEASIQIGKYKFTRDPEHLRKSWNDSDNRTAVQNSSRFSKFVLESLPLKINGKDTGKNIGSNALHSTMSKIFGLIQYIEESPNEGVEDLVKYVYSYHDSPTHYAYKILDLISNSSSVQRALQVKAQFTDDDLGVVQSLLEYVFSYDTDMHKKDYEEYNHKSIRAIEYSQLTISQDLGKYSILNDIVGVIDDCMDTTYIETTYSQDGAIKIGKRPKYKDRRVAQKIRNTANNYNINRDRASRLELQSTCSIIFDPGSRARASVSIPMRIGGNDEVLRFNITNTTNSIGVLNQGTGTVLDLTIEEGSEFRERVFNLFDKSSENNPIDLSSTEQKERLIAKEKDIKSGKIILTEDEEIFRAVLKFIDDRLLTDFLSYDGLQKLYFFQNLMSYKGTENVLDDLLLYAVKGQIVSDLYLDFNDKLLDPSNTKVNSYSDFVTYLKTDGYPAFSNLTREDMQRYFIQNNGIYDLRTIPDSTQWVDTLAHATLMLWGETDASTSKNQDGNNDANYVTSFLGGNIYNVSYNAQMEAARRTRRINAGENIPQSVSSPLLFTKDLAAIKQCVINSDVKNRAGKVKQIRDLKTSELFYNSIIHNFWMNYILTGEYCIQPTTYSDKVKLIQYLIDSKYSFKGTNGKYLSNLDKSELIELYRSSIGESSRLAEQNVIHFYEQIWEEQGLTLNQINQRLKHYTKEQINQLAFDHHIEAEENFHFREHKSKDGKTYLTVNETIASQAKYSDYDTLAQKFAQEEVNFVNNLVDSGVLFYIDYHDTSMYRSDYSRLSLIEQLKMSSSPVARIILHQYNTEPKLKEFFKKWVRNGKLVLAYNKAGKAIIHENVNDVAELNPLLEQFFYIDTLIANNIRLQLTGYSTNHPDKSKFNKMVGHIANGLGIHNQLLNNTTWRNPKGEIVATDNIDRLQKANIIWGHPGLGKTTYDISDPDRIIEWDKVFNAERNRKIAEWTGDTSQEAKQQFLQEFSNYLRGGEYLAERIPIYEEFRQMVINTWEQVKADAKEQGKKIFASPMMLLEMFGNDFDLILATDAKTFLKRKPGGSAWKADIDKLLSRPNFRAKTINVGDLYMSDIMALNDGFDLHTLNNSSSQDARRLAESLTQVVNNIAQGTQLKRNVIIPATLHYVHKDFLSGVSKKIKVACIEDMEAVAFNFMGDSKKFESMDGAALTTAEQSILENMGLGSQEVGADKKPIWHDYSHDSGGAKLMKFASFEINNERMLKSQNSPVPLLRMYKKMTNLPWSHFDEEGNRVWDTGIEVNLGKTINLASERRVEKSLKFIGDIIKEDQSLYYKAYDYEDAEAVYRKIEDFGGDYQSGYYTIESHVDEFGNMDPLRNQSEKVYHYFDADSNHYRLSEPPAPDSGLHTINSNYELWLAMGGMHSQNLDSNNRMTPSESSHYAVVGFMNSTIAAKQRANTDRHDITQRSYNQPIKGMMIGYLTNMSAMKNGAANVNSVKRWDDNERLIYMEMDSSGLGIQMDADHDVELAATMTEFSQVISALESGGALHKYAKQVYQDLGKIALTASKVEVDKVVKLLSGLDTDYDQVKSELYEIVAKTLINGIKTREDGASLTDRILNEIERSLGKKLNHKDDVFKVPFSDSNIYSQILPTFVSLINQKSIKRKYPGSGCVMVPAYNVMTYFMIDGKRYMFDDLIPKALEYAKATGELRVGTDIAGFEKRIVQEYLDHLQENETIKPIGEFIPCDIVDLMSNGNDFKTLRLDDLKTYYAFKDITKYKNLLVNARAGLEVISDDDQKRLSAVLKTLGITEEQLLNIDGFRHNIRQAKNLSPVRITFKRTDTGEMMNVFDLAPFRAAHEDPSQLNRKAVQEAFKLLDKGTVVIDGKEVQITDLSNKAAEMIVSNMYRNEFGVGDKSVAQIREEGVEAFRIPYKAPIESKHYDLMFAKMNGEGVYISFQSPKGDTDNYWEPYDESELLVEKDDRGNLEVYLTEDNRKKFKVGRYMLRKDISYTQDEDGSWIFKNMETKEVLESKHTRNFKTEGSAVYEYVEFVSRYRVKENITDRNGIRESREYEKYYINHYNVERAMPKDEGTSKKVHTKQMNSFISHILDDIYATEQFLGITINPNLKGNSVKYILHNAFRMQNIDPKFKETVWDNIKEKLQTWYDAQNTTKDEELKELSHSATPYLKSLYTEFYDKLAQDRYTSWEQSLYFTAARIPAQTLQSFMQMEAVAYSGNSRNIVYVSHWQAWLQGSDYDIDKAYIMGQVFGHDGKLVKYSDLFDYTNLQTLQASTWLPTPRKLQVLTGKNIAWDNAKRLSEQAKQEFKLQNDLYETVGGQRIVLDDEQVDRIISNEYNIDSHLEAIKKATEERGTAGKIRAIADAIIDIYDFIDRKGIDKAVNITYSEGNEAAGIEFTTLLNKHEKTVISPNLEEAAYKNSISANIRNIVQDLKNMNLAYSPISMDDLQELAEKSEKGALIASMSLMNPLTKYVMQVQNMVGKKVIGIAAVGEKVFFNLSYYFNEGIRSGDERWMKNMLFKRTFNRIQGRYQYNDDPNAVLYSSTKTHLANVNFEDLSNSGEIRRRFLHVAQIDEAIRKKLGVTDEDIRNNTEKCQRYRNMVQTVLAQKEEGLIDDVLEDLHITLSDVSPVDLIISQILSAATDNAKELILDKINCDDNLARCHLYLVMLGFDIKDVVSFMISPCVNLVSELSRANMMDSYMSEVRVDEAMNLVEGRIDTTKFIFGTTTSYNEWGQTSTIPKTEQVLSELVNTKLYSTLLADTMNDEKAPKLTSLDALVQAYIKARLSGKELKPLNGYTYISDYETSKGFNRLSDYVEKLIYSIQKAQSKYAQRYRKYNEDFLIGNANLSDIGPDTEAKAAYDEDYKQAMEKAIEEYNADLQEFRNVYKLASETTTLGGTFLGMNQGLPGSKEDLLTKLRGIKQTMVVREKEFGIQGSYEFILDPEANEKTNKRKQDKYEKLIEQLIDNNEYVKDDIELTLKRAVAFDIVRNFNIEYWLYDKKLTAQDFNIEENENISKEERDKRVKARDVKNKRFMDKDLSKDEIFEGKPYISYRELVADYYNIIKGTWNIFDIINKVPQYRAIVDLLKTVYAVDKHSSSKSAIINEVYERAFQKTSYIDDKQNKQIVKYVDDLLISSFFRESNYHFPIFTDMEYLDPIYRTKIAKSNRKIDLNNAPGRASFKMAFEKVMMSLRQRGKYGNINIKDYKENAFLQGLNIDYDNKGIPRGTMYLDMMKIDSTPNSRKVFQQYLQGFEKLKTEYINEGDELSLADWFILYNLFVNKNEYGSDRFTTVFKNSISKGTVLEKYFQYVGDRDFAAVSEDVLQDLGFNIDDLLIRMAPTISRSQQTNFVAPYVRVRNTDGEMVIKQWRDSEYHEISTFPNEDLEDPEKQGATAQQKANYFRHQMIPMKNQDFSVSLREGLMSDDVKSVVSALSTYARRGRLQIIKENC